jgi:hypothetical protein
MVAVAVWVYLMAVMALYAVLLGALIALAIRSIQIMIGGYDA